MEDARAGCIEIKNDDVQSAQRANRRQQKSSPQAAFFASEAGLKPVFP
jgi:hypothetical protein